MKPSVLANYVELVSITKDSAGKIIGATLQDKISNATFSVKAKVIVNCTGIHSDKI